MSGYTITANVFTAAALVISSVTGELPLGWWCAIGLSAIWLALAIVEARRGRP